jgi:hypothetical protein
MELYLHYGRILMLKDNFTFKFKEESILGTVCGGLNKVPGSNYKKGA